jgi:hypothetical protein
MIRPLQCTLLLGLAVLVFGSGTLIAQNDGGNRRNRSNQNNNGGGNRGNQGNFDPAQFQQRMLERYKQDLEITSPEDWQAITPLVEKLMTARREAMSGFGRRGGGGPGGPGGRRGGGQPPEATGAMAELQKALDAKAGPPELRAKIAAVADETKTKEAALQAAQEALRKVLTTRQEGLAVVHGLLPPKKS